MLDEKYGVTPTGFSRKRLDEIIGEIHSDLSEGFGFDTKANQKSFLGVLVTNISDKIAELWEVAEQSYNSFVPSSAEGVSLDRVAQLGGSQRRKPAPSVYTILCTGKNGTVIPVGTRIESDTNPAIKFTNTKRGDISLSSCVAAEIAVVGDYDIGDTFSISVDGERFEIEVKLEGENPIESFEDVMKNKEFWCEPKIDNIGGRDVKTAVVLSFSESVPHEVVISSNLDATRVTSLVNFDSEEFDDIVLPANSITKITVGVSGLESVRNLADYIKGNGKEKDTEFRKSYVDKIFIRSRTMLESIKSAILANCNGVESVSGFENDTNVWDYDGCCRAPHSVEMVVVGGNRQEIAEQIFATKAAGINTSHCCGLDKEGQDNSEYAEEVEIEDDYGKPVIVRFSRPVPINCEFVVKIVAATNEIPANNTFDLIKSVIFENVNVLNPGDDLVPKKFLKELYEKVPGVIDYEFVIKDKDDDTAEGVPYIKGVNYNRVVRCQQLSDIIVDPVVEEET